ncbi:helix-turn-helix domain-containing protein [Elizabethkingia anophelis]|nr:helix-turn-helix domain-containing protein [Elizabethkingia anophelis]
METVKLEINGINLSDLTNQLQRIETHLLKINTNPQTPDNTELLTRKEVSELLGITLPTVNEWTKKGILKAYRMGTRLKYKKAEIMETLTQNKVR